MLRFASTTFRNYAQAAPDYCESYLTTSKNRARTGSRTLRIASARVEESRPNDAPTSRIPFASVEKYRPNGARSLSVASENVGKCHPSCARTLRIDLRALKTMPERRTNVTKMLPEQRLAAARVRPRAMACNVENPYLGGRARQHCAARGRRRKNGAFLDMQSGPCFQRRGCVAVGT